MMVVARKPAAKPAKKLAPAAKKTTPSQWTDHVEGEPHPLATAPDADNAPLGAHVSIAGGTANAALRVREIGASAAQIFTKQANRWAEREVDDDRSGSVSRRDVADLDAMDVRSRQLPDQPRVTRSRAACAFARELPRGTQALSCTWTRRTRLASRQLHGRARERPRAQSLTRSSKHLKRSPAPHACSWS